ncbi:MAG: chalcone isomerase [Planctomycetes bacterium]|nr:chalcone isomerase [Planctomycetota bacterium]
MLLTLLSPAIGLAVELTPTLKVGDQKLVLNGSGVREKYFFDLYVAGLYLTQPNSQAATIIDADAPMSIRIVITSKLVSQEKFIASLQEGLQKSTQGNVEPIRAEIQKFRQCFADEIARNDVFDLIYSPGQGLAVLKNGKQKGAVPGLAFKRALFGIWLSDRPADATLKQALLGNAARR